MSAQALEALSLANGNRLKAAAWRRETAALPMREGLLAMALELAQPDRAASMPVHRFLKTAHHMGTFKAQQLLAFADVNPVRANRPLRDLTPRERHALAFELHRRAA